MSADEQDAFVFEYTADFGFVVVRRPDGWWERLLLRLGLWRWKVLSSGYWRLFP